MPQHGIFRPDPAKLKNALAAVVGKAIASVKRFATALHNRCNLVVFTDASGRTCSTFLRRDAFTGYHFEFAGDKCLVTNKETGDIYTVSFDRCSCPAFYYSSAKKECKHQMMVAQMRGKLGIEQVIAQTEFNQYIEQQAATECAHPRAITGLDAHFCPDCKKSIEYGTAAYEKMLNKSKEIDLNNVPVGCLLKRTDDWMCEEYNVWAWGYKNERGVPRIIQKHLGRLVQHTDGIYTYRVTSGIARTFQTSRDAIAYLVRVVGTSFEEIGAAFDAREQLMRQRIARL
jgi:hypothetical protein